MSKALPGTNAVRTAATLAFVIFVLSRCSRGAEHPVPLDKNSNCLECHEDKAKGKFVHTAIGMGCDTCHEVRTNRGVTRVKLTETTPAHLCLTCHEDKDAAKLTGPVHPPSVRDCLKCHDPHVAYNKNLLLKPTSGAKGENLCLDCHTQGTNVPSGGTRHDALDTGCDTCHTIHKTGSADKQEFEFHLASAVPGLCTDCHQPGDADLQKAHHGQPFEKAVCTDCHEPHQSTQANLLQKFTHPPFAQNKCEGCHKPANNGKVVLTNADSKALCLTCHSEKGKQIDGAKVPHIGAQMSDCVDCHSPHASAESHLPKGNWVSTCLSCHTEIADLEKKSVHHEPAFGLGCPTCHEGHGGNNEKLLRATGNALCLECHGPDSRPVKDEARHVLTIFNGTVELPWDYYQQNRVAILPIQYGLGHPVANHPVQDVLDPTDSSKVKFAIGCLSCHQPHASAEPGLLMKDQADNMAFCDNCHKNRLNFQAVPRPSGALQ